MIAMAATLLATPDPDRGGIAYGFDPDGAFTVESREERLARLTREAHARWDRIAAAHEAGEAWNGYRAGQVAK